MRVLDRPAWDVQHANNRFRRAGRVAVSIARPAGASRSRYSRLVSQNQACEPTVCSGRARDCHRREEILRSVTRAGTPCIDGRFLATTLRPYRHHRLYTTRFERAPHAALQPMFHYTQYSSFARSHAWRHRTPRGAGRGGHKLATRGGVRRWKTVYPPLRTIYACARLPLSPIISHHRVSLPGATASAGTHRGVWQPPPRLHPPLQRSFRMTLRASSGRICGGCPRCAAHDAAGDRGDAGVLPPY
jgi:hypothetical protein